MGYLVSDNRKVTTHRLMEMKQKGEKISMLTSYDYTMAGIVDKAGVDIILIGDSASNVMVGNQTTLPMTVDQMIYHAKSVARAAHRALVLCDMPFGSYQVGPTEGVSNAIRIMKESGCDALKMEGGVEILDTVKRILDAGIPVMAHLGLTPQSINKFGTYAVRAKEKAEADKLMSDAIALADAGCFGITLEKVTGRRGEQDRQVPHHRHRCRQRNGRPGACHRRHAGHDPGILAPLPAPLRRPEQRHHRGCRPLCGGRQEWRLPQ